MEIERISEWRGQTVVDPDGQKIGRLAEVYRSTDSGEPRFARVKLGLLGNRSNLVPLDGATVGREYVRVRHTKDEVKKAPSVEAQGELTETDELELRRHYGIGDGAAGRER